MNSWNTLSVILRTHSDYSSYKLKQPLFSQNTIFIWVNNWHTIRLGFLVDIFPFVTSDKTGAFKQKLKENLYLSLAASQKIAFSDVIIGNSKYILILFKKCVSIWKIWRIWTIIFQMINEMLQIMHSKRSIRISR